MKKKGMLNGIVILSKFPFENVWTWDSTLLLILNIFSVFKKGDKKALIPKLNPVYWTEFISFRAVRTASTQLPIGLEIEKKNAQNRLLHFIFTWVFEMEKSCFFMVVTIIFLPVLNWSFQMIWSYFISHDLVRESARTLTSCISWCVCKIIGSKHTNDCQFTLSAEDY